MVVCLLWIGTARHGCEWWRDEMNACIYAIWLLSATFSFEIYSTYAMQMSNWIETTTQAMAEWLPVCCLHVLLLRIGPMVHSSFTALRHSSKHRVEHRTSLLCTAHTIKLYATNDAFVKRCTILWDAAIHAEYGIASSHKIPWEEPTSSATPSDTHHHHICQKKCSRQVARQRIRHKLATALKQIIFFYTSFSISWNYRRIIVWVRLIKMEFNFFGRMKEKSKEKRGLDDTCIIEEEKIQVSVTIKSLGTIRWQLNWKAEEKEVGLANDYFDWPFLFFAFLSSIVSHWLGNAFFEKYR